ncbi:MAG: hypothetical protein FWC89_01195 [Defluviitaleaceae bacterium]|nr:hypothetical protein [Defluviitaleaceae bacterium]
MVNRQKIITMTKLALYDKHEGASDRAANDYFRHDYIYRKNLGTRLSVGIGAVVILALYWLRIAIIEEVDIFELYIQRHAMESILFILAVLAVYSLIGTIQGTREYYLVQKRLQQYQGMLRFLENADERRAKAPMPADSEFVEKEFHELEKRRPPRLAPRDAKLDEAREARAREREKRPSATGTRIPLTIANEEKDDPLANVSSRALKGSGSRPRTALPLTQRPAQRASLPTYTSPEKPKPRQYVRPTSSAEDTPLTLLRTENERDRRPPQRNVLDSLCPSDDD